MCRAPMFVLCSRSDPSEPGIEYGHTLRGGIAIRGYRGHGEKQKGRVVESGVAPGLAIGVQCRPRPNIACAIRGALTYLYHLRH